MKTLEDLSLRITWFSSPRGPTCLNRSECRVLFQHLPWWSLAGFPTQMIECCCSVCVCVSENCLTLIYFKYSAFARDTNVCTFFPKLCSGGRMGGWGGMCFDWCELEPVENKTHSEFTCFKYCLFICTLWYFCVEWLSTPGLGLIKQQWRVEVYMACFTGLGVLSLTAQNNMNLGSGLAWNAGPTWPLWLDNTSKDPRIIWSLL